MVFSLLILLLVTNILLNKETTYKEYNPSTSQFTYAVIFFMKESTAEVPCNKAYDHPKPLIILTMNLLLLKTIYTNEYILSSYSSTYNIPTFGKEPLKSNIQQSKTQNLLLSTTSQTNSFTNTVGKYQKKMFKFSFRGVEPQSSLLIS